MLEIQMKFKKFTLQKQALAFLKSKQAMMSEGKVVAASGGGFLLTGMDESGKCARIVGPEQALCFAGHSSPIESHEMFDCYVDNQKVEKANTRLEEKMRVMVEENLEKDWADKKNKFNKNIERNRAIKKKGKSDVKEKIKESSGQKDKTKSKPKKTTKAK